MRSDIVTSVTYVTPVNKLNASYVTDQKVKVASPVSASVKVIQENFPSAAIFYLISMAFSASQSIFGKVLYRE